MQRGAADALWGTWRVSALSVEWRKASGKPHPEIEAVRIAVEREHQGHGGDIWIDDVQLEEGDSAGPHVLNTLTAEARVDMLRLLAMGNAKTSACCVASRRL